MILKMIGPIPRSRSRAKSTPVILVSKKLKLKMIAYMIHTRF